MSLERVNRWQWIVLSLTVGFLLGYARRVDPDVLLARLGEGADDQAWFEREVQRRIRLADGTTVPAFGRLTVYPMTVRERSGVRTVHIVAGMYLTRAPQGVAGTEAADTVGEMRPCFFIAPEPYPSLADPKPGNTAASSANVREYLDGLRSRGVTYAFAWWVVPRYAMAVWVGGSVVLIGLLWPTALNLLLHGSFRRPKELPGISLWKVRGTTRASARPAPRAVGPGARRDTDAGADRPAPLVSGAPEPNAQYVPAALLSAAEEVSMAEAEAERKDFGSRPDDYYPTELHPSPRQAGES